ncbi:hypothetical protein AcV5_002304 [Taiwanofungus camphoratus]|nr:hypothetical protein AcV5_002304 [Antrodia cinnamomea]KAI0941832.1 hypothetical protein AcV7_002410 [Antrodia cinnamomea]
MPSVSHLDVARYSKPCRFYAQGNCRYGASCRFAHNPDPQGTSAFRTPSSAINVDKDLQDTNRMPTKRRPGEQPNHVNIQPSASSSASTADRHAAVSNSHSRPPRPCRAWKAGACSRGAKCWFAHDPESQGRETPLQPAQTEREESLRRAGEQLQEALNRARQAKIEQDEAARQLELQRQATLRAEIVKQEAAKTIQRVVLGSVITFSAGLCVARLITGFESCTVHIKNLPPDAREDEVCALFTQQGVEAGRFLIVGGLKRMPDGKREAKVITDAECGHTVAVGLDGIQFRDETLVFEAGAFNSPGSMFAAARRDTEVLTISWPAPSTRYVVEYPDIAHAEEKARVLNRGICAGRRVKVEMNSPPPGRIVPRFRPNSIKISNLPLTVSDRDVEHFSGSTLTRRLADVAYNVDNAITSLRTVLESAAPGTLIAFDQQLGASTSGVDNMISVRAQFNSWDDAQKAYERLSGQRYPFIGNTFFRLRLPTPMHYTIFIASEQYKAQRMQWDALSQGIKDRKACTLAVFEQGNEVRIRVSGSVREAVGALKVRVESLTEGQRVDGWHRSLGAASNAFVRSVFRETGAHLHADWRRQTLKLYGDADAVERARALVKAELERLSSLEYTIVLKRQSVRYFIQAGLAALTTTFGEDNIRFSAATRKLTITGGEEARHAVERQVEKSLREDHSLANGASAQQVCPVCYDDISSPVQLGCGHIYCTACLRHFLMAALDASDKFSLTCIGDESRCDVPIPIPTIQSFLPPAVFNRLLEMVFVAHVERRPQELRHCTTPDCMQIYRVAGTGNAMALQCPSCFATICAACHGEAHEGLSCAEYRLQNDSTEQERLSEEWIEAQNGRVKKCPSCSVPIEKLEGCNHMSCRYVTMRSN